MIDRCVNRIGCIALSVVLVCLLWAAWASASGRQIVFAVATGYPPYQYVDNDGEPAGLDVDVINMVCARIGVDLELIQGPWEDMLTALRTGRADCIAGMEVHEKRKAIFEFTTSYYSRRSAVFTLSSNDVVWTLLDLRGLIIAGDRHSFVETRFSRLGLKRRIRIRQTSSKDESIRLLKAGEVVAFIAPVAVARRLASIHNVKLRVVDDLAPGMPVAMAVNKGKRRLRDQLDAAIHELFHDGSMDTLLRRWNVD